MERLPLDAFLRHALRILQARATSQQHEAASLLVADRLSQAIAQSSSPLNLPYIFRERRRQLRLMEGAMQHAQAEIVRERQLLKERRAALVERARLLAERFTALGATQQRMASAQRVHVAQLTATRSLSSLKLRLRRRKMVEHLLSIYPLHIVPLNRRDPRAAEASAVEEYMIRGIRLPNVHHYQYEEQAATGFSYVCHLLLLLASVYAVSVRYRLVYRSSRSYVWDDVVSGTMFPLFWKGVERERFEMAVFLLNKNIEHVKNTVLERGDGYALPTLPPVQAMGDAGGGMAGGPGGAGGGAGGTGEGQNKKGEHQTLDNLKALIDVLLPNDEN